MSQPKFYVGQKVVCICTNTTYELKVGKVYTVGGIKKDCCQKDELLLWIEELDDLPSTKCTQCNRIMNGPYYYARRFRPLDEGLEGFREVTFNEIREEVPLQSAN